MPYIIEMKFDGEQLAEMWELAYVDKSKKDNGVARYCLCYDGKGV